MDDDIRDKQLEEQAKPLAMRLFQPIDLNNQSGATEIQNPQAKLNLNEQLTKIINGGGDIEESKD